MSRMLAPKTPSLKDADLMTLLTDRESGGAAGRIVRALSGRGSKSLTQLAALTGFAKSTISVALTELRSAGMVVEVGPVKGVRGSSAGRPETVVSLNPEAGTSVGILIGLDHIQVIVADVSHAVLADKTVFLEPDYSPEQALKIAKEIIDEAYETRGLRYETLLGVGLAIAAPINPRDGRVLRGSGVPTWTGTDIRALFQPALKTPVFADNESNCSAIAEMMWGSAIDQDNFVFFTVDVGVGGAIVFGGNVMTGFSGSAGEFGHMSIDPNGPPCRCGNRGCLERYISDPLIEIVRDPVHPLPLKQLVRNAGAGDAKAIAAIETAAMVAGRGLAIVGTIINPPLVVIGGELATAGDLLIRPLQQSFERHTLVKSSEVGDASRTAFLPARFVDNEGCMGAVGLVLRHHGRLA